MFIIALWHFLSIAFLIFPEVFGRFFMLAEQYRMKDNAVNTFIIFLYLRPVGRCCFAAIQSLLCFQFYFRNRFI